MSAAQPPIRAKRFPIQLPMQYRLTGSPDWENAQMENISCSGVLFRARAALRTAASIELMLPLPPEISGEASVTVLCGAYVARVERSTARNGSTVGAAFVDLRLMQAARGPRATLHGRGHRAAAAVHGINNALAVIVGNCELLLARAELDNGTRKSLLRIKESAQRASKLAGEL